MMCALQDAGRSRTGWQAARRRCARLLLLVGYSLLGIGGKSASILAVLPFLISCVILEPAPGFHPSATHHSMLTASPLTHRMEKNTSALHKEAKAYLDAVRSVSASSTRIATTIDLFFGSDAGDQAMSANAYKRAVEEWEGSVSRSIVRTCGMPAWWRRR